MHVEVVLPLGYAYKRQAMIGKSHDASMVRALFFFVFLPEQFAAFPAISRQASTIGQALSHVITTTYPANVNTSIHGHSRHGKGKKLQQAGGGGNLMSSV